MILVGRDLSPNRNLDLPVARHSTLSPSLITLRHAGTINLAQPKRLWTLLNCSNRSSIQIWNLCLPQKRSERLWLWHNRRVCGNLPKMCLCFDDCFSSFTSGSQPADIFEEGQNDYKLMLYLTTDTFLKISGGSVPGCSCLLASKDILIYIYLMVRR